MIKSLEFCSSETALKLSSLEQKLFSMSWDASIIEQKINDKSFKYWIYEDEKEIIGYLGIQFIHHDIEILGIGVLEEYRKKGVATELMDLLIPHHQPNTTLKVLEVLSKNLITSNPKNILQTFRQEKNSSDTNIPVTCDELTYR